MAACRSRRAIASAEEAIASAEEVIGSAEHAIASAEQAIGSAEQAIGSAEHAIASAEQAIGAAEEAIASAGRAVGRSRHLAAPWRRLASSQQAPTWPTLAAQRPFVLPSHDSAVTPVPDPYRPPAEDGIDDTAPLTAADRRHLAIAFTAWLVGGALFAGAVQALQGCWALRNFGADQHVPGLVAVSAFRVLGAHGAAAAAAVAIAVVVHHRVRAAPGTPPTPLAIPWRFSLAVPIAAPIAAAVTTAAALATSLLVTRAPPGVAWSSILDITRPVDPLVGVARAAVFALPLALSVPFATRRLAAMRRGLVARVAAALLATGLVAGALGAVIDAALDDGREQPSPLDGLVLPFPESAPTERDAAPAPPTSAPVPPP